MTLTLTVAARTRRAGGRNLGLRWSRGLGWRRGVRRTWFAAEKFHKVSKKYSLQYKTRSIHILFFKLYKFYFTKQKK